MGALVEDILSVVCDNVTLLLAVVGAEGYVIATTRVGDSVVD